MARTFTAQEHRESALALLDESLSKGIASPARSVILAEAQIHATLALSASQEATITVLSDEPVGTTVHETLEALAVDPKPATKRRTRKAPATAASEEEGAK